MAKKVAYSIVKCDFWPYFGIIYLYVSAISRIASKISMSVWVNSTCLRAMARRAMSKNLLIATSENPAAPPSLNEATKLRGNPDPWMLHPTPTTVAVLNIVLMPALEWSAMISPQN